MRISGEKSNPSGLTVFSTLGQGEPAGRGTESEYFRLTPGPGEAHLQRDDLLPAPAAPGRRSSLLHFAYLTDLHVLDPASPGRFEFAERLHGSRGLDLLLPAYRPQDFLQLHACESMIRTVSAVEASPVTGASVQFLVFMGDVTDNAQLNELQQVIRLFEGGTSLPWPGGAALEGVASDRWGDPGFWHPSPIDDDYKRLYGFPAYPGVLAEACEPFELQGVGRPWLACQGNHDTLVQGSALPNTSYERIVTGSEKAHVLPRAFDTLRHLDLFIPYPEMFLVGPASTVTPDLNRRNFSTSEYLHAVSEAAGEPSGHGFGSQNLAGGTAYYVDDRIPMVRTIVLDTVNLSGYYQGSVGAKQLSWLEERLAEVHSRYWDAAGRAVETRNQDRLVVLCSHHPLVCLINDLTDPEREPDLPRVLGPEVEALLHRFPNLVLWVNGHTHRNAVRPRPDPEGKTAGFWEVTSSSMIDWPCQARLVEIISNGNGSLSILCTMVDDEAPADPREADGLARLAAIHRELAANDPHAGLASGRHGLPTDRNVELLLAAPFLLE